MKQAEDGMWKMILSIALGQPLSEALASFAVDYNESFQLLRPHQEALRAHFMNGCLKDDKTPISATLPTVTNGDTASGQAHAEEVENGGDSTSQDGASPSQAISSSLVKLRNDSTSKSAAAVTSPHESLDGSANAPSGSSKSNSKGSSKLSENLNTREAVSQDKPPAPPALRRESKAVNKWSSGQNLTAAPPPKKRRTNTSEAVAITATQSVPIRPVAKNLPAQELQMFWRSAERLLFNASHYLIRL